MREEFTESQEELLGEYIMLRLKRVSKKFIRTGTSSLEQKTNENVHWDWVHKCVAFGNYQWHFLDWIRTAWQHCQYNSISNLIWYSLPSHPTRFIIPLDIVKYIQIIHIKLWISCPVRRWTVKSARWNIRHKRHPVRRVWRKRRISIRVEAGCGGVGFVGRWKRRKEPKFIVPISSIHQSCDSVADGLHCILKKWSNPTIAFDMLHSDAIVMQYFVQTRTIFAFLAVE